MLILLITFLIIMGVVGISRPTWFVFLYIIASTSFLGFGSLGAFTVNGLDVGFFLLNVLTFCLALANLLGGTIRVPRVVAPVLMVIIGLYLWGVLSPVFLGYQGILQSFIASKHFFHFTFFVYLMVYLKLIDVEKVQIFCKFLGLYLAFLYFFNFLFGLSPPYYLIASQYSHSFSAGNELVYSSFRVLYPTYIGLAVFLFYKDIATSNKLYIKSIVAIVFLLVGLALSGFEALTVASLLGMVLAYIIGKARPKYGGGRISHRLMLVLVAVLVVVTMSDTLRNAVISRVEKIVYRTDAALVSRDRFNEFRWAAIQERPIFGHGFVHKDAAVMSNFRGRGVSRFSETLGTIDSGYVDLMVRFGYLGLAIYMVAFVRLLATLYKRNRGDALVLSMCLFSAQYLIVGYTWSVFSYPHGILPLSLAILLMLSSIKSKAELDHRFS